jgi:hypothetical protein
MLVIAALLPAALLAATPALAATKAEKMQTCEFGAKDQNLEGAKATAFIKKCMGSGNYEPAARRDAMKKTVKKKKVTAKPAAAKPMAAPAPATAPAPKQ